MRAIVAAGLFALLGVVVSPPARGGEPAPPSPEVHALHVTSEVSYRCYGGYGHGPKERADNPTGVRDPRTGFVCDNKSYKKTLLDKVVGLEIRYEPNPEGSRELVGDWESVTEFMGRKFTVAVTLFKQAPAAAGKTPYRLRLLARDDEPLSRETVAYVDLASVRALAPITLAVSSVGGPPVELSYSATFEPGPPAAPGP